MRVYKPKNWLEIVQGVTMGAVVVVALVFYIAVVSMFVQTRTDTNTTTHHTKSQTHVWTKADSLAYAHDRVLANAEAQFSCLSNLWGKESAGEAKAHNPVRIMGKTAGGIPQLLGMSPLTPPTQQIDRGLGYVYYRYGAVCKAWDFWRKHSWY